MKTASLGFRVKSGWAAAVLLAGPAESPQVLDHRIVELSDPAVPASRQPYHGGRGREERDGRKVARRVAGGRRLARGAIAAPIKRYPAAGHQPRGGAVRAGSDNKPP